MAADLGLELADSYAPLEFYTPGDHFVLPGAIRNNGADSFSGYYRITAHFLRDDGAGGVVEAGTHTFDGRLTNLAPDASQAVTTDAVIDGDQEPGQYIVRFELAMFSDAARTQSIADEYPPDNTQETPDSFDVRWIFGTFGSRSNVVFRSSDADGTVFTLSLSGPGYGEITVPQAGGSLDTVIHGSSTGTPLTITASMISHTGSADAFIDYTGDISVVGPGEGQAPPRITAFTGAALNITGNVTLPGTTGSTAGPNITINDIRGRLEVDGNAGVVRTAQVLNPDDGTTAGLFILGSATSVTTTHTGSVHISVDGTVGAVTVQDMQSTQVSLGRTAGAITARDIFDSTVEVGLTTPSISGRDVRGTQIDVNFNGLPVRTAMAFTFNNVSETNIRANAQVTTFAVSKWTDPAMSMVHSSLGAVAIGTLTTRAPTADDPTRGPWGASVFVTGGINRPTQLGSATINGTLTGSFIVGGSVGTFTARTVQSITSGDPQMGWGPALAASGTVGTFTATNAVSGALWAGQLRTVNLGVASNNASFEVAAGLRLNREDIAEEVLGRVILGDPMVGTSGARWAGGSINALNVTLRTSNGGAVTGFKGRFIAGVDLTSQNTPITRDGTGNIDMAASTLRTTGIDTVSRINAINVVGVRTGNELQFAFLTYPSTTFNYGTSTPPVSVLIPAAGANPTPGLIPTVNPTNTFFRVGHAAP